MELKMELSQSLGLSQKMIQSTEILQMSAQELDVYLKDLAVENPVIDIEEKYGDGDRSGKELEFERRMEWLAGSDEQNRVYYSGEYADHDDDHQDMYNVTDNLGEALSEYLAGQLVTCTLTSLENRIIQYMIDSLDSRGYFTEDISALAHDFGTDEAVIEKLLAMIQGLEPAGVGAVNLKDCLLIQLKRLKPEEKTAYAMVSDHLELIAKNQLPLIAKKMGISMEQVLHARDVILTLNPKPGNSFSSRENLKYITPDVAVVKLKGYFEVVLNEMMYPHVTINSFYRDMLDHEKDKDTQKYVGTKISQAEWVRQCIAQRNTTLRRVSKEIVNAQEKFFEQGPGNLKPLRLADIAAVLDIHESTVSRAVKDKYLQCMWGVFPMNYFFTTAVCRQTASGPSSADEIKQCLRALIENENHKKPYSDRILTEKLQEKGFNISRRTVAKYREAMGIKDASGRKNFD